VCAAHGRRVEDRLRCAVCADALEAARAADAEREEAAARRCEQRRILDEAGWDEDDVAGWGNGAGDALAWAAAGFGPTAAQDWQDDGFAAASAVGFRRAEIELDDADDWHREGFTAADATAWAERGWDAHDAAKWVALGRPTPEAAARAHDAGCHVCRTRRSAWELERVGGELICSDCVGDCDCCGAHELLQHLGDVEHPYRPEVRPDVDVCTACSALLEQGLRSAWDALFEYDMDFGVEVDSVDDDFELRATVPFEENW
jgi:hypothetical protein